jgi:hypothetical protein
MSDEADPVEAENRLLEDLLAEVQAVSPEQAAYLEEAIALYMEMDWAPFLKLLARLPIDKRRALIYVIVRRIAHPLNRCFAVARQLSEPADSA